MSRTGFFSRLSAVGLVVLTTVLGAVTPASGATGCQVDANVGRDPSKPAIAVFRSGTWYVRGSLTSGAADLCFVFGQAGDQPVVGDWDGDGQPTPGVFRPSTGTWYLSNSTFAQSGADIVLGYGSPGDVAFTGDWDNNGTDTVGIYRPSNRGFYLRNANTSGKADGTFYWGLPGDVPQYQGPGVLTLFRPSSSTWYFLEPLDVNNPGAVRTQVWGQPGDVPLAGPWGMGSCGVMHCFIGSPSAGIYRPSTGEWHLAWYEAGETNWVLQFGDPTDVRVGFPAWEGR
ncbi:hypothetical protein [Cellulomonas wangsupingiae]|uniref:Uncharacterized protein n=1 Tax=Cellulomonas wangsupingiae TaxID=2968085 RepID=A0ABY5K981_9CELL|nr:hypothetical protein [Cellulomonas wangsupingiae]MCC2334724.1 hypothetical protein [Cellulomonas wangsupingiae]UUI66318.1 hypothetical protein NP075_06280 [Cellulomonas wangsupingiae]